MVAGVRAPRPMVAGVVLLLLLLLLLLLGAPR
jgi:hypothetical protein